MFGYKFDWKKAFEKDDVPAAMAITVLIGTFILGVIGLGIHMSAWFFLAIPAGALFVLYSRGYITRI